MTINQMRKRAITLVYDYLLACRSRNVRRETIAHTKLYNFCAENNLDINVTIAGAKRELKKQIAPNMNGII